MAIKSKGVSTGLTVDDKDAEVFHEIMEEIRHIRKRLDDHIDDEKKQLDSMQKDIARTREDIASHKTTVKMITFGVSVIVAAFISWFTNHTMQ